MAISCWRLRLSSVKSSPNSRQYLRMSSFVTLQKICRVSAQR